MLGRLVGRRAEVLCRAAGIYRAGQRARRNHSGANRTRLHAGGGNGNGSDVERGGARGVGTIDLLGGDLFAAGGGKFAGERSGSLLQAARSRATDFAAGDRG